MSDRPTKAQLAAMREVRIMDFAIDHANQIIGELQSSRGDHLHDVDVLEELIEAWAELREYAVYESDGRL